MIFLGHLAVLAGRVAQLAIFAELCTTYGLASIDGVCIQLGAGGVVFSRLPIYLEKFLAIFHFCDLARTSGVVPKETCDNSQLLLAIGCASLSRPTRGWANVLIVVPSLGTNFVFAIWLLLRSFVTEKGEITSPHLPLE